VPLREGERKESSIEGDGFDRDPLARWQAGEERVLEELVAKHQTRLYRIAWSYLRNQDDALEVVQETFIKLCKARESLGRALDPGPWLTRVCVNQAIDVYRHRKRRDLRTASLDLMTESGFEAASNERGADASVASREAQERVALALGSLSDTQAKIVTLRYISELSLDEIARTLDLRLGTVKSNLHRALLRLKSEARESAA
jgi:RNA polymerase sigma-70 factor (ECF subfamily)